jgi:hypothetical protein
LITDCLALVLAGKQPDQNVPANLSNHPVTIPKPVMTTNNLNEPAGSSYYCPNCKTVLGVCINPLLVRRCVKATVFYRLIDPYAP